MYTGDNEGIMNEELRMNSYPEGYSIIDSFYHSKLTLPGSTM
jgi:hypothetical protein